MCICMYKYTGIYNNSVYIKLCIYKNSTKDILTDVIRHCILGKQLAIC